MTVLPRKMYQHLNTSDSQGTHGQRWCPGPSSTPPGTLTSRWRTPVSDMFCSEEGEVELRQNCELKCTLCFHVSKEFFHLASAGELQGAREAPEIVWHIFVCMYGKFLGKVCCAFINYHSGLGPQMVRNPEKENPEKP